MMDNIFISNCLSFKFFSNSSYHVTKVVFSFMLNCYLLKYFFYIVGFIVETCVMLFSS